MKVILVRYGELTLKGKNRKEFERILFNNMNRQLADFKLIIRKDRNRMYIEITDTSRYDEIEAILKVIPGISSFSIADVTDLDIDNIKALALSKFDDSKPVFKVETKRSNKNFYLTSQETSKEVGGFICFNKDGLEGLRVDVRNPQQKIIIELHVKNAYVFHSQIRGMGGLPIGSSGRAVVLLSGGIDSPVAAILAMKRGLKITCVHFSSPPYTNDQAFGKVKSLMQQLHKLDRDIKLHDVNFSDLQLKINQECDPRFSVTILRRMMYKMAAKVAHFSKARVLVTGESLGQVASQTIGSMTVTDQAVENLIIRPCITMDKNEIIDVAKKYNTFEISILPFDDCCVIFLPPNPSTNPKLHDVLRNEEKFDYEEFLTKSAITTYNYDIINNDNKIINEYL